MMPSYARVGSSKTLTLRKAILLYDLKSSEHQQGPLATVHDVAYHNPDGRNPMPVIMPGSPVTVSDIEALSKSLSTAAESMNYLPANVLSITASRLVWHVPGRQRRIWFNDEAKPYLHLNGQFVTHPSLIFDATINTGLRVLAVAGSDRPHPDTVIYRAPYMNLYSLGEMCRGNSPMPKVFTPEAMITFEDSFFNSAFSHTNLRGAALCRHPGGPVKMWNELRKVTKFPARWLAPLSRAKKDREHQDDSKIKTLGDFLQPQKWTGYHPL